MRQPLLLWMRGAGARWRQRHSLMDALLWIVLCSGVALGYVFWSQDRGDTGDRVVLLVPDSLPEEQAIYVNAWKDAGTEEGVPLAVMTATQFSQRTVRQSRSIRGVILPDTIHRRMGDAFVEHMLGYVRGGGHLMLVYDAGALNQQGGYPEPGSRFSELVGLQMIEYGRMREALNRSITLHGQPELFRALHVPPGRYREEEGSPDGRAVVTGYKYDELSYPSLATRGSFPGQKLMESEEGQTVAGVFHGSSTGFAAFQAATPAATAAAITPNTRRPRPFFFGEAETSSAAFLTACCAATTASRVAASA